VRSLVHNFLAIDRSLTKNSKIILVFFLILFSRIPDLSFSGISFFVRDGFLQGIKKSNKNKPKKELTSTLKFPSGFF